MKEKEGCRLTCSRLQGEEWPILYRGPVAPYALLQESSQHRITCIDVKDLQMTFHTFFILKDKFNYWLPFQKSIYLKLSQPKCEMCWALKCEGNIPQRTTETYHTFSSHWTHPWHMVFCLFSGFPPIGLPPSTIIFLSYRCLLAKLRITSVSTSVIKSIREQTRFKRE